jgi:hypothetical protein
LKWKLARGNRVSLVVLSLRVTLSMIVYGFDSIASMLEQDGYLFKMLANDSGVVLFPHTTEHRDATQPGIKYADDSGGGGRWGHTLVAFTLVSCKHSGSGFRTKRFYAQLLDFFLTIGCVIALIV